MLGIARLAGDSEREEEARGRLGAYFLGKEERELRALRL
jgi:hypothetical protein